MSFEQIAHRLTSGRPLVMDADTPASFRSRGVAVDAPGALGLLLRKEPDHVLDHYRAEIGSRVDVLTTLTADTTPRALAEVGMEHRASRLTAVAVDLALEAVREAPKPVAIAGLIGCEMVSPVVSSRIHEEFKEHADRLATAGCELLVCKGLGSRLELMAAIVAAASTDLPTWALIEVHAADDLGSGEALGQLIRSLEDAGAQAVLFETPSITTGIELLGRARDAAPRSVPPVEGMPEAVFGVLVAGGASSVRGFPDEGVDPDKWAAGMMDLDTSGARIIGGGAGTTEAHTAALAKALRSIHPSIPVSK